MVIIWWPWRSWLLVWPSFSEWRAWSLFSQSLYATRTALHKNRMMTMVVIFWMTTMAAIPEQSWKNRRRPWNDDHKERWPWMMTVAKKCQPDQFVDKNRKWKQKPTIRKFEQTFDHWFPHFAVQRKRRLCTCLPEYLKRHWQAFFLPYTDFEILSLWEFGSHRLGLTRTFFFKKSSLWLSPNLSSKSSSVWLALFLYHVDHPNKHHQKIRLTEQISKSPLVLIAGIYWWPNRLPMLETSAKVTGQPWCALILPPSQLPQSRNAISQWRPRLCQWRPRLRSRKKNENTFGHRKNVEKKWKYVWESKKTSKKKRKKHIKNTKKKRKKNEKNSRFFTFFWFFKNWLKIGYFGGLRPGTTKNEKKTKKDILNSRFFTFLRFFKNWLRGGPGTTKNEKKRKKMKKNGKKRKKHEKNSRFFTCFWFFKHWQKIGNFGGLRASLGEEGRESPKRKQIGKKNEKTWKPNEKNEKKNEKDMKKTRSFLICIFQKWAKNRPFWWPPRLSGGEGREPPKMETLGSLSLQEPLRETLGLPEAPKWNLWETSANLVMILVMFLVIGKMLINRINK